MLAGRHSSSSRAIALIALSAVIGMAGCASQTAPLLRLGGEADLRLKTIEDTPQDQAAATAAPTPRIVPVADHKASGDITEAAPDGGKSAWCRYLREDSAAEATILRSPTLSGQIDDQGKASINLGLSMSGFRKAQLSEDAAEARCRRYLAESSLQKIVFLAPQDLTAAGFSAKAAAIHGRRSELERIRKRIRRELAAGFVTAERASDLTVSIDQLYSLAAQAQSQAERRSNDGIRLPEGSAKLSADLLRAESDLQDISSQIRSADSFDVSLEAGYSDSRINDGLDSVSEGLNGRVRFSMKLGAFAPQRYAHEERAKQARIDAVRSEEGGALWQVRMLRDAHLKAITGLEDSRLQLDQALVEARKLLASLESVGEQEFAGPAIQARLQVIQLEAERAAVDGSVRDIRQKLKQLSAG